MQNDQSGMLQQLNNRNPYVRLDAAMALAEIGEFSGVFIIMESLRHDNPDVRIKAAYCCARIGPPSAMEPLVPMATNDLISDNRNQAIWALVAIGKPVAVPTLIQALKDQDVARRQDGRAALYRFIGEDILSLLDDEDGGASYDPSEYVRVSEWWRAHSTRFDPESVYSYGKPAGPEVFIQQLREVKGGVPESILQTLNDWTGMDFGQSPILRVIAKWEKWWLKHRSGYIVGRRYFFGHAVPD